MNSFLINAVLFSFLAFSTHAAVFNPKTFKLANGLEAVVIENPNVTGVTHMLWYRVGSVDEEYGRRGLAHFFEHLMFRGTEKYPRDSFNQILISNGAQFNAFTSWDYTAYYETVAPHLLSKVMDMEADRMVNLRIAPDVFEPEKRVVLEERHMSVDSNPSGTFAEQFNATLFHNHPYAQPVIGWRHEIEGLNLEEAKAFYKKYYNPANAILIVTGNTTVDEVKKLADQYYGPLKGFPVARKEHSEPPSNSERSVTTYHPQVKHPQWYRVFKSTGMRNRKIEENLALEVLAKILGGGVSSTLYAKLVIEEKIAQNVAVDFMDSFRDFGQFSISVTPVSLETISSVEKVIQDELQKIKDGKIDPKDLDRAKNNLMAQATYARDSLSGPAFTFGHVLVNGGTLEDVEQWPNRVKAVTLEMIKAAAAKIFIPHNMVTGQLKPAHEEVSS